MIFNTEVKCDAPDCGWSKKVTFSQINKWHNKLCPQCGQCVIINDQDMAAIHLLLALDYFGNVIDPEKKLPRQTVRVDTAGLRDL